MLRSISSDSTTPTSSSSSTSRKRLFSRVPNPLSSNGKLGPLADTNPPPVARPSNNEGKKPFNAIKTKFQSAGTSLNLLRRLSNSNGQDKPKVTHDDTTPLSKVKTKRGRSRHYSLQAGPVGRPPSIARSRSSSGAPSLSQSSTSPTLLMSDDTSRTSDSPATTTLLQDDNVPIELQTGVTMTKVSSKERKNVTVRIDADLGQIFYQSKRARISESLSTF